MATPCSPHTVFFILMGQSKNFVLLLFLRKGHAIACEQPLPPSVNPGFSFVNLDHFLRRWFKSVLVRLRRQEREKRVMTSS